MIESNMIEWLNFGDSIQTLDIYSKSKFIISIVYHKQVVSVAYFDADNIQ